MRTTKAKVFKPDKPKFPSTVKRRLSGRIGVPRPNKAVTQLPPRTWLVSSAMSARNGSMYWPLTSARAWACLCKTHRKLHPLMSATDVLDFAACGVCAGWKPRRKSTKRTPTVQLHCSSQHKRDICLWCLRCWKPRRKSTKRIPTVQLHCLSQHRGPSACSVCAAGSQGGSQPSEPRRCNFIVYRSTNWPSACGVCAAGSQAR